MKIELIPTNVSSLIKSLRDICYTFGVAVADIYEYSKENGWIDDSKI